MAGRGRSKIKAESAGANGRGPLRILHIVTSHRFAGIERHVLGLLGELRALGCEGELACRPAARKLRLQAAAAGLPVRPLVAALPAEYDILHAHDGRSALIASLGATLRSAALVRTQHFVLPASEARPGWVGDASVGMHRVINRRLDGYVCVSAAAASAARARRDVGNAATVVIPPGVELATAEQAERACVARRAVPHPVVVTAGRLERERRIDVLLDAIPLVLRSFPDCRFVIAGKGKAEAKLHDRSRRLGIDGSIDWTGWLPEIGPALASGHLYVNTWAAEGFGMATAEAMGYALPVVVTNTGASPELVEDGVSGRVIEALDPIMLAGTICELLSNRIGAEAMGRAARTWVSGRYSMRSTAKSTLDFYRQLPRVTRER